MCTVKGGTGLSRLFRRLAGTDACDLHASGFDRYKESAGPTHEHEAGYDAFMTGCVSHRGFGLPPAADG